MKEILRKKLSLLMLPLCLVLTTACGGDNDDDNDDVVLEQTPAPTNEENPNPPRTTTAFTKHCRLADEIPGGNFDHDWAVPLPGQLRRLSFNTDRNRVRLDFQGVSGERVEGTYDPQPAIEGATQGSLVYQDFDLFFPVGPSGTIRGSNREYLIGKLQRGENNLGTYLCPRSLLNEFTNTSNP